MGIPMRALAIVSLGLVTTTVDAFAPPHTKLGGSSVSHVFPLVTGIKECGVPGRPPSHVALAMGGVGVASTDAAVSSSPLMTFFLETLISSGVPAVFSIIVIGFAAVMLGKARRKEQQDDLLLETNNPVAMLYDDLYGDQRASNRKNRQPFFAPNDDKLKLPRNTGVPEKQYLKITHLNRLLDSYKYSLQAATQSKAAAAATFREVSFSRALGKALLDSPARKDLLQAEAEFLKAGSELTSKITSIQTKLTQAVVDEELETLGMKSVYDLDVAYNKTSNQTVAAVVKSNKKPKFNKGEQLTALGGLQRQLQELELDFIQKVVSCVGPTYGASVRSALLGDVAVRGSGGLLAALKERPLRTLLQAVPEEDTAPPPGNLFVTRFPGDATASQTATLREEATAIIQSAKPGDEVLVVLQTGGGTVTGYGLAAAQLLRFKDAGLRLTIAVEQVAASGGYMMCCVADKIVASPFAVLGSIGVISDIPNVYERLKKEGIEFQTVTAGKYKRTLTPTKRVTKEDFDKSKQDVEEILVLFREFVAQNRPQLEIETVATGETWFGTAALEKKLCDEIKTVDDVLMEYVDRGYNVFEVKYEPPLDNPLRKLGLASATSSQLEEQNQSTWLQRGIRWMVQMISSEIRSEVEKSMTVPLEQRYMANDDTASRISAKSE